ncbi:MAG: hypothetical protein CMM87_05720 [Rickettsiales bacterium]|nr:hypothetical protein [Rickettsiales bacterium]
MHATVRSKELRARFQRAYPKARRRVAGAVDAAGAGARTVAGLHVGVVVVLGAAVPGVERDAAVQLVLGDRRAFGRVGALGVQCGTGQRLVAARPHVQRAVDTEGVAQPGAAVNVVRRFLASGRLRVQRRVAGRARRERPGQVVAHETHRRNLGRVAQMLDGVVVPPERVHRDVLGGRVRRVDLVERRVQVVNGLTKGSAVVVNKGFVAVVGVDLLLRRRAPRARVLPVPVKPVKAKVLDDFFDAGNKDGALGRVLHDLAKAARSEPPPAHAPQDFDVGVGLAPRFDGVANVGRVTVLEESGFAHLFAAARSRLAPLGLHAVASGRAGV